MWITKGFSKFKKNRRRDEDVIDAIIKGKIPGASVVRAIGERENMSVGVEGEDMWRGNEIGIVGGHTAIPIPPPEGYEMQVVSNDPEDNPNGSGVGRVSIHMLDSNGDHMANTDYDHPTYEINLNGTTPVDIPVGLISFINDIHTVSLGSSAPVDAVAAGDIKVIKKGDPNTVYNFIYRGGNKSLVPVRKIPRGKIFVLKGWHCEEAKGKRLVFRIRSTDIHGVLYPGVYNFIDTCYLKAGSSGELTLNKMVPEHAIVKISAWGDANNGGAEGSCGFWGILETLDN